MISLGPTDPAGCGPVLSAPACHYGPRRIICRRDHLIGTDLCSACVDVCRSCAVRAATVLDRRNGANDEALRIGASRAPEAGIRLGSYLIASFNVSKWPV